MQRKSRDTRRTKYLGAAFAAGIGARAGAGPAAEGAAQGGVEKGTACGALKVWMEAAGGLRRVGRREGGGDIASVLGGGFDMLESSCSDCYKQSCHRNCLKKRIEGWAGCCGGVASAANTQLVQVDPAHRSMCIAVDTG